MSVCISIDVFPGRLDLCLPVWYCEACKSQQKSSDADLMASGYFRGTPSLISTIFSVTVFHLWRNLKCSSPGTSLRAFAMSLEMIGQLHGTVSGLKVKLIGMLIQELSGGKIHLIIFIFKIRTQR